MTSQRTPDLGALPTARAPAGSGSVAREAGALLEAVGRGDEDAFTRLYDLVAPRVFGLTRWVVPDPAQAEAVAQETLIEVWRTAARYDARKESALAWILAISHRRAVDRVRSAGAARGEPPAVREPAQVRRCLESLTRVEREAILLSYYHGHTYREVAELLGTGEPTIRLRMRDGLIRMRDCLGAGDGRRDER